MAIKTCKLHYNPCRLAVRGPLLTFSSQTAWLLKALPHVDCFTPPLTRWISSFRLEPFLILSSLRRWVTEILGWTFNPVRSLGRTIVFDIPSVGSYLNLCESVRRNKTLCWYDRLRSGIKRRSEHAQMGLTPETTTNHKLRRRFDVNKNPLDLRQCHLKTRWLNVPHHFFKSI